MLFINNTYNKIKRKRSKDTNFNIKYKQKCKQFKEKKTIDGSEIYLNVLMKGCEICNTKESFKK